MCFASQSLPPSLPPWLRREFALGKTLPGRRCCLNLPVAPGSIPRCRSKMRSCLDVLLAPIPHFLHSVHSLLLCEWLAMARCLLGCCMHCQMCFLYRNLLVPDGKAEMYSRPSSKESPPRWISLTSRWISLTSRWISLTSRWILLRSRWEDRSSVLRILRHGKHLRRGSRLRPRHVRRMNARIWTPGAWLGCMEGIGSV